MKPPTEMLGYPHGESHHRMHMREVQGIRQHLVLGVDHVAN